MSDTRNPLSFTSIQEELYSAVIADRGGIVPERVAEEVVLRASEKVSGENEMRCALRQAESPYISSKE